MMTTTTLTIAGSLTKCDVRREAEIDRNYTHKYSPNTEHYSVFLDCELRTDDGGTVYFRTPSSPMNVTSCPGAAVVTFGDSDWDEASQSYVFPADHPWLAKSGNVAVATRERSADVSLVAKVKTGDRITIRGRVKADRVSKAGRPYRVLSHVKRIG
jgi:hypothetical protein